LLDRSRRGKRLAGTLALPRKAGLPKRNSGSPPREGKGLEGDTAARAVGRPPDKWARHYDGPAHGDDVAVKIGL